MTKDKKYHFFWLAFLLTPLFILAFVNVSVAQSSLPQQEPTVFEFQQTVGAIDSLQQATKKFQESKYKEALQISLAVLTKATSRQDSLQIEKTSFLIGNIFKKTNNYNKALEYFIKSHDHVTGSSNIVSNTKNLLNIGFMYSKTNHPDSASVYNKHIINIKTDRREIKLIQARAFANLSAVNLEQNKLILAESNALEALHLQEKYNDKKAISHAQNNLASIYLEQKRFRDAKRELLAALSLIKNDKTKKGFAYKEVIYDNLSWTLYNLKDYRTYIYYEKSTLIRDSLRNAEIGAYLEEIEGKYNEKTIKERERLKTAVEKTKRLEAERKNIRTKGINSILIVISFSLLLGVWLIYRYLKLRQKNLRLEFKQNQLIQQTKLELIQSENREKILNATIDGKESERKMIAETLHHSVSSLLSSASMHLQASKMLLKEDTPDEIEKAQRIVNEAAEKIRNLSHSLVSSVLLKFGLHYAVQDLCDKYTNATLSFHCKCDAIKRYDAEFELKINSIIDEFLNNIIKHSKATNAEIRISDEVNRLIIVVLDDGVGFNPKKDVTDKGLGISQIETRIRKMQGEFRIKSSLNEGTYIYISVPIIPLKNKRVFSNS